MCIRDSNGTVWPWLDGIAIQRMIEAGQAELAWPLFRDRSAMALERGVVGGLPETLDAYPHPGERSPRLTGAFLQAWSNAEHLRVWYQFILGVRPDLGNGEVVLAPRLPATLGAIDFSARVGSGTIRGVFDWTAGHRRYVYALRRQAARLTLDVPPYPIRSFAAAPGDQLSAEVGADGLDVRLLSSGGVLKESVRLAPSPERQRAQAALDALFAATRFASPARTDDGP